MSAGFSVGQVAELAGVTVRTLHHYDEVGLLSPSGRTPAGYRRYSAGDLDRLQRILFYRELGFALEDIAAIVDDPGSDAVGHLECQRGLLVERIERLRRMVDSIDRTLEAKRLGETLTAQEKLEVFGGYREPEGYSEQAVARWGDTPQWRWARDNLGPMTKEDWEKAEKVRQEWVARLLSVVDSGATPDSSAAMDLLEEHRGMMAEFMGECDYPLHRHLAELYATDPVQLAFLVREPDQRAGIGRYLADAATANAARHAG